MVEGFRDMREFIASLKQEDFSVKLCSYKVVKWMILCLDNTIIINAGWINYEMWRRICQVSYQGFWWGCRSTPFIIMGSVVHTKRCTSLSEMLLSHMELTFLTWPQSVSSMQLTMSTCTLDGLDTFHGMGMIAAITPGTRSGQAIPRAKVTSLDVAMVGRVQIRYHKEESHGMTAVTY